MINGFSSVWLWGRAKNTPVADMASNTKLIADAEVTLAFIACCGHGGLKECMAEIRLVATGDEARKIKYNVHAGDEVILEGNLCSTYKHGLYVKVKQLLTRSHRQWDRYMGDLEQKFGTDADVSHLAGARRNRGGNQ